tara:strand:+ start:628 stop:2022 length:1395 start_codon:yes stop_codon:yes gene_type:complete
MGLGTSLGGALATGIGDASRGLAKSSMNWPDQRANEARRAFDYAKLEQDNSTKVRDLLQGRLDAAHKMHEKDWTKKIDRAKFTITRLTNSLSTLSAQGAPTEAFTPLNEQLSLAYSEYERLLEEGIRPLTLNTALSNIDTGLRDAHKGAVANDPGGGSAVGDALGGGYVAAATMRAGKRDLGLRKEATEAGIGTATTHGSKRGIIVWLNAYKEAFGRAPTTAERKIFWDRAQQVAPNGAVRMMPLMKQYRAELGKGKHPHQVLANMRSDVNMLKLSGVHVPDELVERSYDDIMQYDRTATFSEGSKSNLRRVFHQKGLVTSILTSLVDPQTQKMRPEMAEMIGVVRGHWTEFVQGYLQGTVTEASLEPEQQEVLHNMQMLVEKMGRHLTGAAIQTWERDVFEKLFGTVKQPPETMLSNIRSFEKELDREWGVIWDTEMNTERFNPSAVYDQLERTNEDDLFEEN